MTVGFKHIPSNLRTPLFYAEVDPSRANTATQAQRTLVIGQKLATGTGTANIPSPCAGPADAKGQAGAGSMLARMVADYVDNDPSAEVWLLPLSDDGASTKAAGTLVITGPSTAAGTISLYVGGDLVAVPVSVGQVSTAIATAIAAAITANTDLPVTASAANSTVTLTAQNGGLVGNDIDLRVNYRGAINGEVLPAGVTVAITAMTGGATNPSLVTALGALGDAPFDFIVNPFIDTTSTGGLTALMSDVAGRWSYASQVYGHVFGAYVGTYGAQATFGMGLNDPHASFPGFYDTPTWRPRLAAIWAGACAQSLKADPALPLHTVPLIGMLAPPLQSRLTQPQRNALLYDGISTFTVGQDGTCYIEAAITTYQKNAFGQADDSFLQVETMFTLVAAIRALRSRVETKFARVKLADNGTRLPPGSAAVTPNVIRAEIIACYQEMEGDLVENADDFATNLVVERDATNRRRVNVLYPPDLIDGLGVFATLVQFRS